MISTLLTSFHWLVVCFGHYKRYDVVTSMFWWAANSVCLSSDFSVIAIKKYWKCVMIGRLPMSNETGHGGKWMKRIFALLVAVCLLSVRQAHADNFRCPNGNIVSTGDSISIVAAKCDPPASSFRREEPIDAEAVKIDNLTGRKAVYIEVQEWLYNTGSTLLHTLIFRNGILSEVRTGGFVQ